MDKCGLIRKQNNLLGEYLLGEGLLDAREAVGAHRHPHAERRADQLAHRRQLARVEVDRDQQQHLAERRRHAGVAATLWCRST